MLLLHLSSIKRSSWCWICSVRRRSDRDAFEIRVCSLEAFCYLIIKRDLLLQKILKVNGHVVDLAKQFDK